MTQDVVIVGGARTPMCEYVGTPGFGKFKDLSALELGAHATKAALERFTEALAHELSPDGIFVNALAPVAIVLTQSAEYVREIAERNPDMVEPVETMAEAALELCTGRHVGRVVYSRELLHSVARRVRSLDSRRVLGDAQLQADLEEVA